MMQIEKKIESIAELKRAMKNRLYYIIENWDNLKATFASSNITEKQTLAYQLSTIIDKVSELEASVKEQIKEWEDAARLDEIQDINTDSAAIADELRRILGEEAKK